MRMIISASLMSVVLAVSQAAFAQTSDPATGIQNPQSTSGMEGANGMQQPSTATDASDTTNGTGATSGATGATGMSGETSSQVPAGNQANLSTSECDVSFQSNSTDIDTAALQSCVGQLNKDQVKYITVLGMASPLGSATRNQELSQMRAASVAEQLKREFPDARVTSMGVGEQLNAEPSARVTLVSVDPAQQPVAVMPVPVPVPAEGETSAVPGEQTAEDDLGRVSLGEGVETEGAVRMNTVRVAPRLAQDDFDPADDLLPFYGLELSYVGRLPGATGLRWEAGAVGGVLAENTDNADGYEAHGLLGAGYAFNNFVVGARALGGAVWNDQPGADLSAQEDFGGEARIGYEKDRWSVFAGAGATQELSTRLGIDLGILL